MKARARPPARARLGSDEAWLFMDRLGAAYVLLAEIAGRSVAPEGLTLAELVALAVVAAQGGLSQSEWGRQQGVSRQRAHVVAQQLEAKGLCRSTRHGRDSTVVLTAKGKRLTRRLRPVVGRTIGATIAPLGTRRARALSDLLHDVIVAVGDPHIAL